MQSVGMPPRCNHTESAPRVLCHPPLLGWSSIPTPPGSKPYSSTTAAAMKAMAGAEAAETNLALAEKAR